MLKDFLNLHNVKSQAHVDNGGYVEYGYGQVEPNHLSAQRTAQIYAQLPAAANINVLEQGQFVKYDYANGEVNFTGKGEWMLVYNEIKLYREHQSDCEFAMVKDNYQARIYSPFGYGLDKDGNPTTDGDTAWDRQSRYYNGVDAAGDFGYPAAPEGEDKETYNYTYRYDDVTAAKDPYEIYSTEDPFHIEGPYKAARMKKGTTMVPRVLKTNVGDIYTTNMVAEATLAIGDVLGVGANGILVSESKVTDETDTMRWQVVKTYTMPDHQKGVKLMRIA